MKINKNPEKPIQKQRATVQIIFLLLVIWVGIEFHLFAMFLESNGTENFYQRPPGAEGFLPISALMSLYYFVETGIIHFAHPAGFFILVSVIVISFVFGKSFCSWLCPIGTISEYIGEFGEKVQKKIFKRVIRIPKFIDYPLRSLKYLLLGFFTYAIFSMTVPALKMFLDSPYNLVADVKMYYFFAHISRLSLIVIASLFVLSTIIRNFWCRYLCPYGALLGFFSILSPNKIRRNPASCIDCGLCAKACPSLIKVDKVKTVISDECSTCFNCVDVCPVADTLEYKTVFKNIRIKKNYIALAVVGIFVIITGIAMLSGNWQNNITKEEYLNHFKKMNEYGHPTSTEEIDKLNQQAE